MNLDREVENLLAELRALGSQENRAGMARFGINAERALGVSMATLRPIARRLRRNHDLALALWATGIHEVRILAVLIAEPKQLTVALMDEWAGAFDSWDLCDQACMKLFVKTPLAEGRLVAWAADERTFVRRAGFALMASAAVHWKDAAHETFLPMLDLIERHADDDRNYVRKAVNWALRQIGKRDLALHAPALALAEKLAASDHKNRRWIGRDALKELTDPVQIQRVRQRTAKRAGR
ncbi:MAG: DNA alkylation repair protein [Alphaproteobacteria bacterium]